MTKLNLIIAAGVLENLEYIIIASIVILMFFVYRNSKRRLSDEQLPDILTPEEKDAYLNDKNSKLGLKARTKLEFYNEEFETNPGPQYNFEKHYDSFVKKFGEDKEMEEMYDKYLDVKIHV